ncbi:ketopantoate reductase family protein [Dethiobacter alkaliphilus]|uniref:ketopantoate reductase family protein n=1 Tax=Dethiobacter alkaliphilus TaxID=427926 RepID=UPI0006811080
MIYVDTIENVVLVGPGAIGSVYASRIFEADPETIKIAADKTRTLKYRQGIVINGNRYFFPCAEPGNAAKPADLIIVTVKYHHLAEAIKVMENHVGPDTIILSMLNGISSEEILGEAFGMDKILYGICVGMDAVREGTEVTYTSTGKIVFGERDNEVYSPKVEAVRQLFEKSKIPYEIPRDMIRRLWWKFMVNVGINQVSAILRAPYGVFLDVGEASELMVMVMREVIAVGNAVGVDIHEDDIDEYVRVLSTMSPDGKTSMLQDVEAGRKTEVEMFAGELCSLGKQYNVPTPLNEMLFRMILTIEKMNGL